MVTKKDIKDLDFETMDEYCNYIMESRINGQHQQARKLYNRFSARQKEIFRDFLEQQYYSGTTISIDIASNVIKELQN